MNPQEQREILHKWISALRSGEYEQARFQLRRESPSGKNSYCCLGVLGVLLEVEWVEDIVSVPTTSNKWVFADSSYLPSSLAEDLGLLQDISLIESPEVKLFLANDNWHCREELQSFLAFLNDGLNWNFEQIADMLETHLLNKKEHSEHEQGINEKVD